MNINGLKELQAIAERDNWSPHRINITVGREHEPEYGPAPLGLLRPPAGPGILYIEINGRRSVAPVSDAGTWGTDFMDGLLAGIRAMADSERVRIP